MCVVTAFRVTFREAAVAADPFVAFVQVQLLVTSQDVDNYKQIKQDLDQLRSIVEKSELWVYKGQGPDEAMDGASGENEHKKTEVGEMRLTPSLQMDGLLQQRSTLLWL